MAYESTGMVDFPGNTTRKKSLDGWFLTLNGAG
jgi:hypothetical protein